MDIDLEIFKEHVAREIGNKSRKIVSSFYVFGSLARGEKIQEGSDIDSVLVINSDHIISAEMMGKLSHDLLALDRSLDILIDHVIVTKDDLLEILSKSLIFNLYQDGVTLFGDDLKDKFGNYLATCSQSQILNSFLRTAMFRRHLLRKRILKFDMDQLDLSTDELIRYIAKEVMMMAKDYLFFFNDKLVTSKRDTCSFFLANVKGPDHFVNFPMKAFNIRNKAITLFDDKQKLNYIKEGFDFVEEISLKLQEKYKQVSKSDLLNLDPF